MFLIVPIGTLRSLHLTSITVHFRALRSGARVYVLKELSAQSAQVTGRAKVRNSSNHISTVTLVYHIYPIKYPDSITVQSQK